MTDRALREDYANACDTLGKLCRDNEMDVEMRTNQYPVVIAIEPSDDLWRQCSMIDDNGVVEEIDKKLTITYGAATTISMPGIRYIEDALLKKISNAAKKVYIAYLRLYHAESVMMRAQEGGDKA